MTFPLPPADLVDLWPPTGVRAVSGDLELRFASDDLLVALARLAGEGGVHAPERMPFNVPWTRGTPDEVARSVLTFNWSRRPAMTPDEWSFHFAVLVGGEPVGLQDIGARDFPITRTVGTGSWLGRRVHGRGIGTRMRALVLHLAFDGLGAEIATTAAFADNAPSNAVSRKIGYRENGRVVDAREGSPAEHQNYRLDRTDWESGAGVRLDDVRLHGVEAVRDFLGIS
ncbi:GCN5-related protein N-acetyltransferase [Beutenbergia cavernae DSM 12333]|uniref:GCN5-related protein N-acetyltransferase n=1 Tax=Beutenbergia cavernae (strain ATCC BAA-8 / DSM 12333 / CCUG 43141 / JCM 11478 / NBRC 16432 / NCIMB 13614 / HKI 0122) TaxID=471853 RepID=C5BZX8_BEUC1|nr:GNAT family protein [Beutenbergia cavernae]ACQ81308.1 GCN5-related protein N-acetyltransferase [Beutenbergia cavernae DSM 12333]